MRAAGIDPYGYSFRVTRTTDALQEEYADLPAGAVCEKGEEVSVATGV